MSGVEIDDVITKAEGPDRLDHICIYKKFWTKELIIWVNTCELSLLGIKYLLNLNN